MRAKHPKDGNHGKRGWVGGNPRYKRKQRSKRCSPKQRTMGKN